ncbi:CAP domain-containing protein [Lactobacillus acetotolerans]|uniref:CAP domain-containing protein n=1 Tax=Lactobacillus acetotolerans TaxID=1600 RepID=UPI0007B79760|nr:CAP domain-containing protein [Lactobacillus acetotolerans]QGV04075.1 CAP domain-containing protein [Lactobacillus acetotolerans]
MKIKKALIAITTSVLLATSIAPTFSVNQSVQAANYSKSEAAQVRKFQTEYKQLNQQTYNQNNLYVKAPNFADPFNPGQLDADYIQTSMDYVNYYRALAGLPNEANNKTINDDAQIGAGVLAAVNAKTSLRAHGLLGYKKPKYISNKDWNTAESATLGNINFLESDDGATAGEIVTDLLQDDNNIAGIGDTGHRALLLSARATRMGIGAAYGRSNGKFYSVQNGVFADDILRKPVKNTVTFPSNGVSPYELLDSDTPWSVYFANQKINRTPKVYITDMTTNKKAQATRVHNFGSDYYGDGYSAALTFMPGKLKLVNTHKYKVQIKGIYTYTFRLFRQNSTLKTSKKKVVKHAKKTANKKHSNHK